MIKYSFRPCGWWLNQKITSYIRKMSMKSSRILDQSVERERTSLAFSININKKVNVEERKRKEKSNSKFDLSLFNNQQNNKTEIDKPWSLFVHCHSERDLEISLIYVYIHAAFDRCSTIFQIDISVKLRVYWAEEEGEKNRHACHGMIWSSLFGKGRRLLCMYIY